MILEIRSPEAWRQGSFRRARRNYKMIEGQNDGGAEIDFLRGAHGGDGGLEGRMLGSGFIFLLRFTPFYSGLLWFTPVWSARPSCGTGTGNEGLQERLAGEKLFTGS